MSIKRCNWFTTKSKKMLKTVNWHLIVILATLFQVHIPSLHGDVYKEEGYSQTLVSCKAAS